MLIQKLVFTFCCLNVAASGRVPFFRRDYTYVDQLKAFYKLHLDSAVGSWSKAFKICEKENSVFFYPKTEDEWKVVKTLLDTSKVKANVTAILVGEHDDSGLYDFMTIEGLHTLLPLLDEHKPSSSSEGPSCIMMDVETGNYYAELRRAKNVRTILCKRVELPSCPTIDHDYTIHEKINKCYKVNPSPKTWIEANQTCFVEGGNLAVISSATEANIVRSEIGNADYFFGSQRQGRRIINEYYAPWWAVNDDKPYCVAVSQYDNQLYYKSRECQQPAPFICEMAAAD